MFEFKKYNKITNTYDSKNLKGVQMAMLQKRIPDEWSVTEKIHGSNFACYVGVDEKTGEFVTQFASRNNMLSDSDSDAFYNFGAIKDEIADKLIDLHKSFRMFDGDINIIYGELFGGVYNHKDVDRCAQSKVQKGVDYCPNLNFKVVDMFYIPAGLSVEDGGYVHDTELKSLCEKNNVDYIKEIFRGSLADCLNHSNEFNSDIHKDYGLPDLDFENVCEGVVIKPLVPFSDLRGNRAIFKNKNDKFAEKASQKKNPRKQSIELTDEQQKQVDFVQDYVTMNRLDNLESKIGKLEEAKQIGQFIKAFVLDVMEDVKYETDVELDKPARIRVSKMAKDLIMTKLYSS